MKTKITKLEIITERVGQKERQTVKGTLDMPQPNNPERPCLIYFTSDEMVELCEKHSINGIVDLEELREKFGDDFLTLEVENYTFNFPEYPHPITVTILQYKDMETGEWCPVEEPECVARLVLKQLVNR